MGLTPTPKTLRPSPAAPPPYKCADEEQYKMKETQSPTAAAVSSWLLKRVFVPIDRMAFGSEVAALWSAYLDRRSGDSLAPLHFDQTTKVGKAFQEDEEIRQVVKELLVRVHGAFDSDLARFIKAHRLAVGRSRYQSPR